MHLFDDAFVRQFGDRAINIHRAFRGAHAVRDALDDGARWIGATAHMLDAATDRGRVLVRKPLLLPDGAFLATAIDLLRPVEQKIVAGGVMRWVYER